MYFLFLVASWGGGLRHCFRVWHVVSDTDRFQSLGISLVPFALSSDWVPVILVFYWSVCLTAAVFSSAAEHLVYYYCRLFKASCPGRVPIHTSSSFHVIRVLTTVPPMLPGVDHLNTRGSTYIRGSTHSILTPSSDYCEFRRMFLTILSEPFYRFSSLH